MDAKEAGSKTAFEKMCYAANADWKCSSWSWVASLSQGKQELGCRFKGSFLLFAVN